jgi:hypothetical protein
MKRHFATHRIGRPLAAVLLCAMLMTQALGLLHRVAHGHAHHAAAVAHADELLPTSALGALFDHHHEDADCQVFDQLCHADVVIANVVEADAERNALPQPPGRQGPTAAVQAAGYLARGPPGST